MLLDRTIVREGFKIIVRAKTVENLISKAILDGLTEIGKNYRDAIKKNVSLDDHSLAELAKLGHPYSVDIPPNFIHDDRLVHEQSGKLFASIRSDPAEYVGSGKFSVFVTSTDPKMPFLIYGTSTMRPRKFHEKAYEDIKETFWNPVIKRAKGVNYSISKTLR